MSSIIIDKSDERADCGAGKSNTSQTGSGLTAHEKSIRLEHRIVHQTYPVD